MPCQTMGQGLFTSTKGGNSSPDQTHGKTHILNKEVKRRADGAGIFPSKDSILRLIGPVLFEQNDDRQSQHR